MDKIQAVFIDRDGTIGGDGHFIHPSDFKPFYFFQQAIDQLKKSEVYIFAFTNQHRIAKGQATEKEFYDQFLSYGFDDAFICPHGSPANCECHKPAPGLLIKAAKEYNLDLSKCVVIGDVGSTDMLAAEAVGAIKVLVKTGWGEGSLENYRSSWKNCTPDYVAENSLTAVNWIESTYYFVQKSER